jgi:hypothetical protein
LDIRAISEIPQTVGTVPQFHRNWDEKRRHDEDGTRENDRELK